MTGLEDWMLVCCGWFPLINNERVDFRVSRQWDAGNRGVGCCIRIGCLDSGGTPFPVC